MSADLTYQAKTHSEFACVDCPVCDADGACSTCQTCGPILEQANFIEQDIMAMYEGDYYVGATWGECSLCNCACKDTDVVAAFNKPFIDSLTPNVKGIIQKIAVHQWCFAQYATQKAFRTAYNAASAITKQTGVYQACPKFVVVHPIQSKDNVWQAPQRPINLSIVPTPIMAAQPQPPASATTDPHVVHESPECAAHRLFVINRLDNLLYWCDRLGESTKHAVVMTASDLYNGATKAHDALKQHAAISSTELLLALAAFMAACRRSYWLDTPDIDIRGTVECICQADWTCVMDQIQTARSNVFDGISFLPAPTDHVAAFCHTVCVLLAAEAHMYQQHITGIRDNAIDLQVLLNALQELDGNATQSRNVRIAYHKVFTRKIAPLSIPIFS